MKKTLTVVVLLLVVISIVTVVDWCKSDHLRGEVETKRNVVSAPSHVERSAQTNTIGWRQEAPLIDPAQRIEIQRALDEIVVAFSNRQVKAMNESFAKVTEVIRGRHRGDLGGSVYAAFMRELDVNELARERRILYDFKSVEEFRRYAQSILELARILGELELMGARSTLSTLENVDFRPLYFFERYREKYQCEKRPDLEASVKGYIEICHARIESENGFIRTAMRKQYRGNIRLAKQGQASTNDMIWAARAQVMSALLTFTNYKPKWLETEFPLPAGYKPGGDGKGACLE